MAFLKPDIRIVVVGDEGTGKSTLIKAVTTDSFHPQLPHTLSISRLPAEFFPDKVPVTIVDTSSSLEKRDTLGKELKLADAVILTYACDRPDTLDRLGSYWLPELRKRQVRVPVMLVGCKLDARVDEQVNLEEVISELCYQFTEIENCIECSAKNLIGVPDVFYYTQAAVLHPIAPLFDKESGNLQPRCIRALTRVFTMCDHDCDGALSDEELNNFQETCFGSRLQQSDIESVKMAVKTKLSDGVNERGITLKGFLLLQMLFIVGGNAGRLQTWTALRKFDYDNEIKLRDDVIVMPFKRVEADQSVELTEDAVIFLKGIFSMHDFDGDNVLQPADVEDVFAMAPENPWLDAPYKDAGEKTKSGGLSLAGFLSMWSLMTLIEPRKTLANLIYMGFSGNPGSALSLTRRRRAGLKKKQPSERNVFQCFVFGPKNAGKSTLLSSFLNKPFAPESYARTTSERIAVNYDQVEKKTLVLREIPEDAVKDLLVNKESLATCDVAVFVHDSSDEQSWEKTSEMLNDVIIHGETTGFQVPCLIVSAKNDLDPFPMATQDSERVSQKLGIKEPIPIKLDDVNNVFQKIVSAAEHPYSSLPETEAGRKRKQQNHLVNRSVMYVSVGAAVAFVGLVAYRSYARSTSS
ncbi:hypothetical protein ACHQM5_009887 [Ranunculus cassubicifolius]